MKRNINYIVGLLSLVFTFTACDKTEPDFFDKDANGAYFDYNYTIDFDKIVNFSEYIVENPDVVVVKLKVKLLGYIMDEARTLAVKTKEIEDYEPAEVTIDKVVFANKEYEKEIEVKVKRPAVENKIYAICIYLDGSGDIGTGIKDKNEINLYVTEQYDQPIVWYGNVDTYLGAWSKEKHIFLAKLTNKNDFYSVLYNNENRVHDYDSMMSLHSKAVNAILATEQQEPVDFEFKILKESENPNYTAPHFWKDYEQYMGVFTIQKFCRFVSDLGGATTKTVADLFASDAATQKMQKEADTNHKTDVINMLNEYYSYASNGYPLSEYKERFWVKIKNNVNYIVRIPFWWEDRYNLGTAEIVKKYFGEYSEKKYNYMLKTMAKEDGYENFVAASILPFIYDKANGVYSWDETPFGEKQLAGEERLKECYRIIKAANDRRPEQVRLDFPDVAID